jgi:hypothetical protein
MFMGLTSYDGTLMRKRSSRNVQTAKSIADIQSMTMERADWAERFSPSATSDTRNTPKHLIGAMISHRLADIDRLRRTPAGRMRPRRTGPHLTAFFASTFDRLLRPDAPLRRHQQPSRHALPFIKPFCRRSGLMVGGNRPPPPRISSSPGFQPGSRATTERRGLHRRVRPTPRWTARVDLLRTDGSLYVASGSNNVTKFSSINGVYGRVRPRRHCGWRQSLTFGPDGNLYVLTHSTAASEAIWKFNGTTPPSSVPHRRRERRHRWLTFGPDPDHEMPNHRQYPEIRRHERASLGVFATDPTNLSVASNPPSGRTETLRQQRQPGGVAGTTGQSRVHRLSPLRRRHGG